MKVTYKSIMCLIILTSVCYSKVEKWVIKTYANATFKNYVIDSLHNDTLYVSMNEDTVAIAVKSIIDIRRKRSKRYIGIGAQSGAVIGGVSGYYLKRNSQGNREGELEEFFEWVDFIEASGHFIIGAFIGGVVGTIVGAGFSEDEYYRLSSMDYKKRIAVLNMIIIRSKNIERIN